MTWEVEVSDEFIEWYDSLSEEEGVSVDASVDMLAEYGPTLGRPYVDTLKGSKRANLKELRVQQDRRCPLVCRGNPAGRGDIQSAPRRDWRVNYDGHQMERYSEDAFA
jgi:hypothetical protein